MSQKALAESAGIDPSYVSLVEAGERSPSASTLESLGGALETPVHLLALLATEQEELTKLDADEVHDLARALLRVLVKADKGPGTNARRKK